MRLVSQGLFAFVLIFLIAACDKSSPMPNLSWGYLEAKMNTSDWHKTHKNAYQQTWATWDNAFKTPNSRFWIASYLLSPNGYLRQELLFFKVPISLGKYPIMPAVTTGIDTTEAISSKLYTSIDDGDVAGDSYNTLNSNNNFIEITKFNPQTNEVWGRFQVTLLLERANFGHFLPDTLRFTEGKFHTKILTK